MAPPREILLLLASAHYAFAFGETPIMGYNSYNQVGCSPNDAQIRAAINAMDSRGFVAAGYKFFQIDCGWPSRDNQRNETGYLKINTSWFPNGLKPLSDLARSKGMTWSMYSDAGVRMCDTQAPSPVAGSLGHEAADARLFASLNTEYVKYDNCYADGPSAAQNAPKDPRTDFPSRFTTMWNALKSVGIPGMLVCQWGTPYSSSSGLQGPNQWTKGISTSFRLSDDIASGWANVYRIYNQAVHIAKSGLIGPGHFADADLLEVGNSGMSVDEQKTHFAAWAMLKSALMISTNVPNLSTELANVLLNADLIAINQDRLGTPISLVQRWTGDRDVWAGNLANGDKAVLVVNLGTSQRTLSVDLAALGVARADIKNLWTGQSSAGATTYSATVGGHGSLALRLSNIQTSTGSPRYNYVAASTGKVAGGATTSSCSGCSSSNKVGGLGGSQGGSVTISNIVTSQATQTVRFDYINGEVGYLGGSNNERLASVSVNGGAKVTVSFPLSGYNWDRDVYKDYAVQLSGFNTNGANTITISGSGSGYAPDIDRIGVVA